MFEYSSSNYLDQKHIDVLSRDYPNYNGNAVRNWQVNFIIEKVLEDIGMSYKYLEVLCGKNPMSHYLKDIGINVVGLDGGKSAFSTYANDKVKRTKYKNMDIYISDSDKTPFKNNYFDVSYCLDIYRWFRENQIKIASDFCKYTVEDIFYCNKKFIATIREMCRVTSKKIIIVDRFYVFKGKGVKPHPLWYRIVNTLNDNGFKTGPLPSEYGDPKDKLVVDIVRRINSEEENERRVSFYGMAVVGEKS